MVCFIRPLPKSILVLTLLLISSLAAFSQRASLVLTGSWQTSVDGNEATMICSERFFSTAVYDVSSKKFAGTYGGTYRMEGNELVWTFEYHTFSPERVGTELRQSVVSQKKGSFVLQGGEKWKQLDAGTPGALAGAWLITGRQVDGEMRALTPGARRTMKILSGTRFQWIAYNVDTREFSGTGGGTYTTEGGRYTEHIEFFSRDASRVGARLGFDFSLEEERWRHRGRSSKGDPIDEVWTKREKIGL